MPENPTAWLYTVAKNKTKNHLKRNAVFQQKVAPETGGAWDHEEEPDIDMSPRNIADSQLAMIFAVCNPGVPADSQVALVHSAADKVILFRNIARLQDNVG